VWWFTEQRGFRGNSTIWDGYFGKEIVLLLLPRFEFQIFQLVSKSLY